MQLKTTMTVDLDNPVVGDLHIENNRVNLHEGAAAIAQNLMQRLQFFRGEWFLNRAEGVPYFESVLVKNPNLSVLRSMFREIIVGTNGIEACDTIELVPVETNGPRGWRLEFIAKLHDGGTLESADFPALVVALPS